MGSTLSDFATVAEHLLGIWVDELGFSGSLSTVLLIEATVEVEGATFEVEDATVDFYS